MTKLTQAAKPGRAKSRLRVKAANPKSTGKTKTYSYVLKAGRGSFVYRGVPIKMTFGGDARSKELEVAMREAVQNTHAFTD